MIIPETIYKMGMIQEFKWARVLTDDSMGKYVSVQRCILFAVERASLSSRSQLSQIE